MAGTRSSSSQFHVVVPQGLRADGCEPLDETQGSLTVLENP